MIFLQRLQPKHPATRQERRNHFETGIFRGGTDENNRAIFYRVEQRILLSLVKPVDFIDEENRLHVLLQAYFGLLDDFSYVFYTG